MREGEAPASVVLHPAGEVVGFGPFRFDRVNRILSRDGVELPLPPRVLGVLEHLLARPGGVVSKQALMDAVWRDAYVTETSLTEAVSQLRQVLGDDPQRPAYVQTVHRRGYRFVAAVAADGTGPFPLRRAERSPLGGAGVPSAPQTLPAPAHAPRSAPAPDGASAWPASNWLFAAVAVVFGAVAAWSLLRPARERPLPLTRVTVPVALGDTALPKALPAVALTPDGRALVYVLARGGLSQLYVRPLDRYDSLPIAGTEGGTQPFVSPDGLWLGFFADGKLKKVPLAGGAVVTLCDVVSPAGASWGDDGTIVFSSGKPGGLFRVSSGGGTPAPLTKPDARAGELGHWWPEVLPGSDAVVFTVWTTGGLEDARLATVPLHSAASPRLLTRGATYGRYASTGHLVFARKSRLMAVRFDPRRDETRGEPVALFDGVAVDWFEGDAQFALSATGTLAYVPGTHEVPAHSLVLLDRDGREQPLPTPTRPFMNLDPAPDGHRVAVTIHEGSGSDLWLADCDRGTLARLTFEAHNIEPTFAPNGKHVAFASSRSGPYNLFWVATDGTGTVERLLDSPRNQYPESWSPDGTTLAITELSPETGSDIWVLSTKTKEARPFLRTRFDEEGAAFAPGGGLLAYVSNETNRREVFVRPFPEAAPKWQISTAGGDAPFWSPDGREVFYVWEGSLWAAPVRTAPAFQAGPPRRLFTDSRLVMVAAARPTRGFVAVRGADKPYPAQVNLVLGWSAELERTR